MTETLRIALALEKDGLLFIFDLQELPSSLLLASPCNLGEGVPPLQFGETSEIRIGRGQLAAMFNGKSCQMCVCHQIGDSLTISEHLLENSPVSLGRPNDSCTGLIQPALYTNKCLFERERVLEDPWIRPDTNKCGQNRPAQADNSSSG
jgi:hypothetical protein